METVSQQKLKVAINGFGRIGRNFLRCWNGRESSLLDVVAINDSGGVKQVCRLTWHHRTYIIMTSQKHSLKASLHELPHLCQSVQLHVLRTASLAHARSAVADMHPHSVTSVMRRRRTC